MKRKGRKVLDVFLNATILPSPDNFSLHHSRGRAALPASPGDVHITNNAECGDHCRLSHLGDPSLKTSYVTALIHLTLECSLLLLAPLLVGLTGPLAALA